MALMKAGEYSKARDLLEANLLFMKFSNIFTRIVENVDPEKFAEDLLLLYKLQNPISSSATDVKAPPVVTSQGPQSPFLLPPSKIPIEDDLKEFWKRMQGK
jgi:hypothetical protein